MPTATSTLTATVYSPKLKKASMSLSVPTPSASATLRSLYNRAARAFLHRDIAQTHTLIETAFQLLQPPVIIHDALAEHRRKWDILRVTLETTVYADPPPMDTIPETLKANMTESPQTLMSNIFRRSLILFTPTSGPPAADVAHLPSTMLITLLYSTLKIECPEVGRMMAEQWISRRESPLHLNSAAGYTGSDSEEEGYDKVVEIYTLHILPKLEQWEYAKEFLQFEGELQEHRRELLRSKLNAQHAEALAARRPRSQSQSPSSTPTPRSNSPAPSASSFSTTSTSTVMPMTSQRPAPPPTSSKTASSDGTATPTPRGRTVPLPPNGQPVQARSQSPRANSSAASSSRSVARADLHSGSVPSSAPPTVLSLLKASLAPHLTTSKLAAFFILFVLFPLASWVLRIRHRRRRIAAGTASPLPASTNLNVDVVRRRLQAANASDASLLTRLWRSSTRAVADTVKMAGSGLV